MPTTSRASRPRRKAMPIPPDWLSRDELAKALGIPASERSAFDKKLKNWRRPGLVPAPKTRHLGVGVGNEAVYPPETLPMLRDLFKLREESRKPDEWLWELWLAGHLPHRRVVGWCERKLQRFATEIEKQQSLLSEKKLAHETTRKPRKRTSPLKPLYRRLYRAGWYELISFAVAVIVGSHSIDEIFDRAASVLSKLAGEGDATHGRIVEGMGPDVLLTLLRDAREEELALALENCRAFSRAAAEPTNLATGMLGEMWRHVGVRAILFPGLIGVYRKFPGAPSLMQILFPETSAAPAASDRRKPSP